MQNWNQWQVPAGPLSAAMPQPPVGYPAAGTDPMAIMQAYMQYYSQPAPSGYTTEQWAAAQQQNWAQWQQWQQQYQQWQSQYGDKYQESLKQYSTAPPLPTQQPPLPKDETVKPPLPPDPSSMASYNVPPPHQNNLPLFSSKSSVPQNPPLPPNPPLPIESKQTGGVSDKNSADLESAKKMKLDEEKLSEIEKTFDAQFKQWEEQFNIWKQKNANHPDKEQYKQYEAKWTSWREKLLERREQMRRKREQQKQAAKLEEHKKKDLPGGDKILNILSNTENQGLINNLLGIGKTLGLSGKNDNATTASSPSLLMNKKSVTSVTSTSSAPQTTPITMMQTPIMTTDMNQQSWVAQQWAAQYNSSMNASYSGYQMPLQQPPMQQPPMQQPPMQQPPMQQPPMQQPPMQQPPMQQPPMQPLPIQQSPVQQPAVQQPAVQQSPNMSMPPPNFSQPPNFAQQPPNFSSQPPNYMQPPPNFSQPPPNFPSDMFNKPPPNVSKNKPGNMHKGDDMTGPNINKSLEQDHFKDRFDDETEDDNGNFDDNNFGPRNRFGHNDNFGPAGNRFDSNFGSNRFGSKDNDRFDYKNDRFNPGNNRFGPNNDRFGSNDRNGNRFGNQSHNEPPPLDNPLPPEIRSLMEKRKAAMDAFKPRSTFLDPEKTLNVGSLRESFKKITENSLFKPRNFSSNEDSSGSFGNRSSFGPRGSGMGPRAFNEFESKGSPFGSRSDFNSNVNTFGSRDSLENFGHQKPDNFGPRGLDTFSPRATGSFEPQSPTNFGPRGPRNFGLRGPGNFGPRGPDNIGPRGSDNFGPQESNKFGPRESNKLGPQGLDDFGPRECNKFGLQGTDDFGLRESNKFGPQETNDFGPQKSGDFAPRRPDEFGQQEPDKFGPRGPNNFGPQRSCDFGSNNMNDSLNQISEEYKENKDEQMESDSGVKTSEDNSKLEPPPMESPTMPELLKDSSSIQENKDKEVFIVPTENVNEQNDDVVEISRELDTNEQTSNSWMNASKDSSVKDDKPDKQDEETNTNKTENLPFMDEDDPKPTDLNMEPPPELPNLGPVIMTPMDPPPAFIEEDFPSDKEMSKNIDNRPFNEPFNLRPPPPFDMRGPNNFGPRGGNQHFNFNEPPPFAPRGMNNAQFRPPFGSKGPSGPPFGFSGNMNNPPFNPRGINNPPFGPRSSMDSPSQFGPRGGMDGQSFRPRGMDSAPSFRFGMDKSPFANKPFGVRDSFQSNFNQPNDSTKKIPSLFDLKIDMPFKKPDNNDQFSSNNQNTMNFPSSNFDTDIENETFDQQPLPAQFELNSSSDNQKPNDTQVGWNSNIPPNKFDQPSNEPDFTTDNIEDDCKNTNAPPYVEKRLHNAEQERDNGANYDPFEIFKNRSKELELKKLQPIDFCAQKQFNYNHGVGLKNPPLVLEHVAVKVFDYEHSFRRVQELMTTIESYDYGHGKLKPTIPENTYYSMRKDFRNWEESEQNLREYSERMKTWECEYRQRRHFMPKGQNYKPPREPLPRRDTFRENKAKRHMDTWDADLEFKKMKYERESSDYIYNEDKKKNKGKLDAKKSQDKNFAEDDFLEDISWDGDNEQSLMDVSEETRNDDKSITEKDTNGGDSSKKLDISKGSSTTLVEDLLYGPGRQNRPPKIVIILRGPPGSGKSFVAKLIKDKEVEQGGSAPRILSLDDYFLVEKEIETKDENGKKVAVKEMVYEFEEGMETNYTASLIKAFKKNIMDGFFNFIILDSINEKISDYEEMWSFAKTKGFKVYICEMDMDIQICLKRNIHNRSEEEINRIIDYFEPTPSHHQKLDVNTILKEQETENVEMTVDNEGNEKTTEVEDQDSEDQFQNAAPVSKWERLGAEDKLDKLDGLTKHKHEGRPQTMEDFLQVPDYYDMEDTSGKKRVRWADLEERKEQEKMRAVGFVVGHTNWNRMLDPTKGSSALTRTKYI